PNTPHRTTTHQHATRPHNPPPPPPHRMFSTPSHNTPPQAKTTTTQHATVLCLMLHPRTTQHQPTHCQPVPIIMWHNQYPEIRNLLRKEVIQPHLPVRLPCYDLVPITGPTFD